MNCGSLLLVQELRKIWIVFLEPILYPLVLEVLIPSLESLLVEWVDLSSLPALGLLDVSHVRPAEHEEPSEDGCEPAVALVVEPVWLVPIWEFSNVLVRVWSFVPWLLVSSDVWVNILLRDIKQRGVSSCVRVRVVKSIQSSCSQEDCTRLLYVSQRIHF